LRELELIRRWQPRCNVQGQPRRRRRVYVCIGRKPAPYLFLATKPTAGVTVWFGPVPGGATAREAVRRVNDAFGLRDCPQAQTMAFADQQELFPVIRAAGCLRHEIGTCLGPCAAACTQAVYRDHVRAARDFLSGVDPSLLDRLNREMHTAANELAFERAAALRDRLRALTWLRTHLDRLRQVRERQSYLYPVHGTDGRVLWYLVHGGKVMTVLPDVDTDESARVVGQVYRRKVRSDGPVPVNDIDGILLVASWFRRHPNERLRLVDPAALAVP
jgi:excinuclease ABC subunit C